ncbi:MAG: MMPL family transporter [Pseudomonadota bacterium]|nr:MMPL family transporter [Pseudomonadota bacterium]
MATRETFAVLVSFIVQLVDLSRRFAAGIIIACVFLAGFSSWYAAHHFKINTDVNQLLSADLPWRRQEAELEKAFPQTADLTVIVIDGVTPDEAENAAALLAAKLSELPTQFKRVERPDAIPFFRKNGLLYLPAEKVTAILEQLVQAQPMLGVIAHDPSLRGFFKMLEMMLQGLAFGQTDYARLEPTFIKTAETVEAALQGQDKVLEWQAMGAAGDKPSLHEVRKFILAQPVLDYSALEPGAASSKTIRGLVESLHLTKDKGVRVRLTGPVPLNDEEFASVADGTGTATLASALLVFMLLLWALRSLRIVLPILLTLVVGLLTTTAFALAAIGSLNLISVAFAVMFIGIAVDFGIQFGVRYRDQHYQAANHAEAMSRTARVIAIPLAMAAGSTSLGFFSFMPTAYRGVSELGLIAGAGMLIAFFLNLTLLPALLSFTRPRPEAEAIGYKWAAPVDAFLITNRRGVLGFALLIALLGGIITTQLRFDFDPLNLKDTHTESVSTLFDIMHDPDSGFYKAEILRPSLKEAQDLGDQLQKLPEVDHVMTLASFIPADQDTRLAEINDTRTLLEATLTMTSSQPAPSDEEVIGIMQKVATDLHGIEAQHASAGRLARALDAVAASHDPSVLERLNTDIVDAMQTKLAMVQRILGAQRVTAETITDDLKRDWVTPDGRYLVQAYPKGSPPSNQALRAFTDAVRKLAPDAAGAPVYIQESGRTVTNAFVEAGFYAVFAIALLSFVILRRVKDVVLLLAPLILAGILTLATIVAIDLPLNFANIIALPLLLSLGVSYAIYFVSYWRAGMSDPLQSSVARAVFFSAATVLVAFGSLALSSHPGTAGMGKLLTVALLYSLTCTFFILPALLGPVKPDKD